MGQLGYAFPHVPPDNHGVARRHHARQRLGAFGGPLGDVPAELPNRILTTTDLSERGPITSPVIPAPAPTDDNSLLQQIRDILQRLPTAFMDEFRTRFIVQPRETSSFVAPGGSTTVAAGSAVAIVTQQIQNNFCGFLTNVGVYAAAGNLPNITWQIRINGAIHPLFSNRVFTVANLANPYPFACELTQACQVQLVAINNSGAPIDVSGILIGWTEFMASYKRYGSSPQSGIG